MSSNTLLFEILLMVIHVMGMQKWERPMHNVHDMKIKPVALQTQLNSTDTIKLLTAVPYCPEFINGDGTGDSELNVGHAESAADCLALVLRSQPTANGVTFTVGGGSCFAEFGLTSTNNNNNFRTCKISLDHPVTAAYCGESFTASNAGATSVVGNLAGDVFYDFHLDSFQTIVLDSCNSDFDTWIRVFQTSIHGVEVCGCDDCGDCGNRNRAVLDCELYAGDYVVVVEGYASSEGSVSLSISCQADCQQWLGGSVANGCVLWGCAHDGRCDCANAAGLC